MRILLIHQAFASNNQAGGTRHYELGGYLVNRGHELVVIGSSVSYLTGDRSSGRSDVPGLRVLPSWTYATRSKGFVPRLASFLSFMLSSSLQGIKAKRVDVVWGTSPPIFQALSAYLVARVKRRPFVLEVRDLWPDFAVGLGVLRNPVLIRLSRWLERHLYKHAEVVVANSPGFEPHLLKSGVRRDRLRLVPNGVDIKLFPTTALNSELREEKGWSDRFVAMYTGAHGLANDLDVLIDAACLLSAEADVLFVLVGDGRERKRLMGRAKALKLKNVEFVDPIPKEEIPGYLAAADVGVAILQPISMFETTYPNKVFDYMAAGRPTVLAIDGVIRKVIEEAQGGLFVHPGDPEALAHAVRTYRDDPKLRVSHGRNARSFVEARFQRSAQAVLMEEILQRARSQEPDGA